jgi:hypothetical protein
MTGDAGLLDGRGCFDDRRFAEWSAGGSIDALASESACLVGGIPSDLVGGERIEWDRLLSPDVSVRDPRMRPNVDSSGPSCLRATGRAYPPLRSIQLARSLSECGGHVGLASICQASSATPIARAIIAAR